MSEENGLNYTNESIHDENGRLLMKRTLDERGILLGEDFFDNRGCNIERKDYDDSGKVVRRVVYEYDQFRKCLRYTVYDHEGDVIFVKETGKGPEVSEKWRGSKPYTIGRNPNWKRDAK